MNPIKTSFITAAGVTMAALSVVYGSYSRECVDNGKPLNRQTLNSEPGPVGAEASNSQIPEDDFFRGLVLLLKREYVEPITDERKLAIGAVKGMVDSLKDPRSVFMDANEFRVYNDATEGKYEGIGVDVAFDMKVGKGHTGPKDADTMDPSQMQDLAIPRLAVVAVTPGGPADQAGVRAGDWVDSIEGHWVLSPDLVEEYRRAVMNSSPNATKGLSQADTKQRMMAARAIGKQLRARLDSMIMPLKARDMLTIGDSGSLKIVWHRGDATRATTIAKKTSEVPIVENDGVTVTVRFADGAAQKLKKAIAGKSNITLDLRDNSNGDFDSMLQCLAVLAPNGDYGLIHSDKVRKSHRLVVSDGNSKPPRLNILVDNSTRGAADVLATALASRNLAKLSGQPSADRSVIEVVALPDGSGYTLATGEYLPKGLSEVSKHVAFRAGHPRAPVAMRERDGTVIAMRKWGGNA